MGNDVDRHGPVLIGTLKGDIAGDTTANAVSDTVIDRALLALRETSRGQRWV